MNKNHSFLVNIANHNSGKAKEGKAAAITKETSSGDDENSERTKKRKNIQNHTLSDITNHDKQSRCHRKSAAREEISVKKVLDIKDPEVILPKVIRHPQDKNSLWSKNPHYMYEKHMKISTV